MNELEARRLLLADPRRLSPELKAAVEGSTRLAAFRDELMRTDEEMGRMLTANDVPEGLAERIVLRARYRDRSRWGLALAASLVAVAIAAPWYFGPRAVDVERAMIAHVDHEVAELQDNIGIEPAVLRASVAALGVDVRDAGYRIRHLANCIVDGREGRHFTVDGPNGVVSFLVLPAQGRSEAPELLREGSTRGVFMKRAGVTIGAFAQEGADRAQLERLMHQVFA
ncbi:MAG: DUF3379 family protein [Usitatibacter sp.]